MIKEGLDKKDVSIKETIKYGLSKTINIFRFKNILNLIYPLIFIVFIYIGIILLSYNYIDSINIMFNIMFANAFKILFILIGLVIAICLFIKGLYTLFDYIINDIPFIKSFNNQSIINNIKILILLFLKKIIPYIIINIFVIYLSKLFFYIKYLNINTIYISILEGLVISSVIVLLYYYLLKSFINDALLLVSYYYKINLEKVSIVKDINRLNNINKLIIGLIIFITNIVIVVLMHNINIGNIKYRFVTDVNVDITAHRGASRVAPENSMAAFREAYNMGVKYIELDVHITKDGYVYVMHDDTLKRMLNINEKSNSIKYKDIKDLTLNSKYDNYLEEKIPLLEDVLKWYKDKDFILNIELKPINNEYELLVNKTLELINKYNIKGKCVVASFNINAINYMHEIDDSIKYVYLGYQYYNIDYINIYSINYAGITKELVDDLHSNNKTIYAWTLDNKDIIESMLNIGVDNIITNDPIYTKEIINNYKNKDKTHIIFDLILFIL
jgi:glycerophosphoryl diester phosphodiesterase